MIKDSGTRQVYSNGFNRDFGGMKGRMDLLPWNAIREVSIHSQMGAEKYGERNIDKGCPQWSLYSSAFRHLSKVIDPEPNDTEDTLTHLRAACWNMLWALEQYCNGKADIDYSTDDKCEGCLYFSNNPDSEWYMKCCLDKCYKQEKK